MVRPLYRLARLANTFPAQRSGLLKLRTYATMAPDFGQWKLNHTMLRIKDPKRSLDFYSLLGLSQVNKLEFPDNKFDLYFLGMATALIELETARLTCWQLMTAQNPLPLVLIGLIEKVSLN